MCNQTVLWYELTRFENLNRSMGLGRNFRRKKTETLSVHDGWLVPWASRIDAR
jgi:hypothetical protein